MDIENIKVEEFTTPFVIELSPDESLDFALDLMQEHNIRHIPIIHNQEVLGIISEKDILSQIGKGWEKMLKVQDIMSTNLLTVHKNDNLGEVAYQLSSQKKGSAIVLDDLGQVFGIFTTIDALNALVEIIYPWANEKSEFKSF